jgi:putative SOS response-associated peptidase YedK
MRWGLVPSWWSKPLKEMKSATFNARAETAADRPMFLSGHRDLLDRIIHRQLAVAAGRVFPA